MRSKFALLMLAVLFTVILTPMLIPPRTVSAGGQTFDTPQPNVSWFAKDSVASCPAGDSVVAGHPGRLRITVVYSDANEDARVGVPPESIWVTRQIAADTLVVNDEAVKTYADDSTNSGGFTRITVPSFSGNGKVRVTLYVSGVSQGYRDVFVRTTDTNFNGRSTSADIVYNPFNPSHGSADINYSGSTTAADLSLIASHDQHWHRQALHGRAVRRSNLRDTAPYAAFNTIGAGGIAWSPSGTMIAYSAMDTCPQCPVLHRNRCRIQVARTDGHHGDVSRQISYAASLTDSVMADSVDYDPGWSPIDHYVFYVRSDVVIHRKGMPGYSSDTSDVAVIGSAAPTYRTYLSVSPNGDSLAYVKLTGGKFQVCIASAAGGYERQLTSDNANYYYPKWSPDGARLVVERLASGADRREVYIYDFRNGSNTEYFAPSESVRLPTCSPDSAIVVAALTEGYDDQTAAVLDATVVPAPTGITAYPQHESNVLFPHLSPNGTRLAMLARDPAITDAIGPQLFAVRHNMNLPPLITQVGSQSIADSTVRVSINCVQGLGSTITVYASDSDTDTGDIDFAASFLKDGMTFNTDTHALSWTPSAAIGTKYNVKFIVTTPSGGVDAVIATLTVTSNGLVRGPLETLVGKSGQNGLAYVAEELERGDATLDIFDVTGRKVSHIVTSQRAGVGWNASGSDGRGVANGIYFYRLLTGSKLFKGRVIVVR